MASRLKSVLVFFATLGALAVGSAARCEDGEELAPNTPISDKWAVVVGISEFVKPSLNLKYAAKDASDFKNFLVSKCHFAPDHIRLITNQNATKNKIMDVLGDSWLPRVTLPADLVVIYISSHGSPSSLDVAGVNYIVAHDTDPEKLFTTGIPIQHLAETIRERVHSKRVLIVLDACHSGAASGESKGLQRTANVDASAFAQGTGHAVICSSSRSESSWESKNQPNGVFTKALIDAFASKGESTKLTDAFGKLKEKVQTQVAAERGVMQTPVLEASKWKGDELILAAVPASPRPAPIVVEESAATKPVSQALDLGASVPAANEASTAGTVPFNGIPDITGDWLGTNNLVYHYWQKGRKCGWEMPMFGTAGTGVISADGKTMDSEWHGLVSGRCKSTLEVDENGKIIRMQTDNGVGFTRVGH